ncbi:thioredoxin-like protein [Panaeolus papilionaceus]|nr:thioredoxin-like protein [Panaeolus papilionaceus]
MLIVHHLNDSRSQRILWLLEELDVPYEIKTYQRTPEMQAPPELLKVNPLGKSPVITDGELNLAESGAIVEYLISKYGNGKIIVPESGLVDEVYYKHYAEGSLMPLLTQYLMFTIIPQKSPFFLRPILKFVFNKITQAMLLPQIKANFAMVESHLAKRSSMWIAGGSTPTAADFQMAFCLEAVVVEAPEFVGPKTKAYVEMVHKREAYQRASKKGGDYKYAK